MKRPPLLSVATPPHIHDGSSIPGIYFDQLVALLPAAVAGCLMWGLAGVQTLLLAVGSAVVFEWVIGRLRKQPGYLSDGSVLVQGVLLGLMLHAATPWWLVLIASLLMVVFAKHFFGGIGGYPFSPPLLSYAIILFSWPTRMNTAAQFTSWDLSVPILEPLVAWRTYGVEAVDSFSLGQLLWGQQLGGVGSSMVLWLAIGGIYLILRGHIDWRIPLSYLATVFVTAWLFHLGDPGSYPGPFFHLFSGITFFAALFLATDLATSPVNPWAQVVYGAGCGLLTVLIRTFGVWPDGAVFALMLMSLAQPLIDKIQPKVIGVEVPAR